VIELVLDDAGRGNLELELDGLALRVDPFDRHALRPLDRHEHTAERQAPLLVDLGLLRGVGDDRVHDDAILLAVDEDEQPS
jgi:hypothetical protein